VPKNELHDNGLSPRKTEKEAFMNHLPHSLIHTLLNLSQYLRRTLYLTNIFAAQAEWQKFCKAFYSNVWHKRAKLQHSIKISAKI
jgi:hypothetical protein